MAEHKHALAEGGRNSYFNLHRIREDRDGVHVCDSINHYVIRENGSIHRTRSCEEGCIFFGLQRRLKPNAAWVGF